MKRVYCFSELMAILCVVVLSMRDGRSSVAGCGYMDPRWGLLDRLPMSRLCEWPFRVTPTAPTIRPV